MNGAFVVATLCAGVAALAWTSGGFGPWRLASVLGRPDGPRPRLAAGQRKPSGRASSQVPDRDDHWYGRAVPLLFGGLTGILAAALVQSAWGVLPGSVVGLVAERVVRRVRSTAAARRRTRQMMVDLPICADLLAACFHAGANPVTAATVVSDAVGGPVADGLNRVVALLSLGADPAHAWAQLAHDAELSALARAVTRAVETGAPVAQALSVLADDVRHTRRAQAQALAHRAGVYAVAPLGLCFLPAFVLLGVVPVVAGIAAPVLGLVLQ